MNRYMDVVTFGETMVLFNPDQSGPLRYVNNFNKSIGGAESNVAMALSKLGHSVGWFSRLGDDAFGKYIQSIIRGEGVDVSRVNFDASHKTGILFKERFVHTNPNVYYYRKNSAASHLSVDDIDSNYIKNAKILHVTGITPALSLKTRKAVFEAIKIAKENNVLISFDPNIRLKLWNIDEAKDVLTKICEMADIILPGCDEGEIIVGTDDPEEIAERFIGMGCSTVAVKLGAEGCYVANEKEKLFVSGYKVKRVEDTVGAGDGFAAGFLAGYLRKLSLKECAEYANGVGAMAVLVKGDMEGYPNFQQLMEFIGKSQGIER